MLDPRDGAELLPDRRIYRHAAHTAWRIELESDTPETAEYTALFHTAPPDSEPSAAAEPCVVFTLSLPDTALYLLQIRICPTGEVVYESHVPLVVRSNARKKAIVVRLLASVRAVAEGVEVVYKPE